MGHTVTKNGKTTDHSQAFPRAGFGFANRYGGSEYEPSTDGMEMRDYFAIKALQGMLTSHPIANRTEVDKDKWASIAYEFGDAMMRPRLK